MGRQWTLCLILEIFSLDHRSWGIHSLFLRGLRKPTEESKPTARVYFRLPPPAGKALGGFKSKQGGNQCFLPNQVSQPHRHHKVGLVQRRSSADKCQVVNNNCSPTSRSNFSIEVSYWPGAV